MRLKDLNQKQTIEYLQNRITELEKYEEFAKMVAKQYSWDEAEEIGGGDYEEGYDSLVRTARALFHRSEGGGDE